MPVALRVDGLDFTAGQIDALDTAASVARRETRNGERMPADFGKNESAVIADINLAIGPDSSAVGCTFDFRDDFFLAIGSDASQRATFEFDDEYTAVF